MAYSDSESKLTSEAQGEIRKYMLRLVIAPAAALSIISAGAGFVFNKIVYQQAYLDAYSVANKQIIDTAKEVGEAKGSATLALSDMKAAISNMNTLISEALPVLAKGVSEASTLSRRAREIVDQASQLITTNMKSIATVLSDDSKFRSLVVEAAAPEVRDLSAKIEAVTTALSAPIQIVTTPCPWKNARFISCEAMCQPMQRLITGGCDRGNDTRGQFYALDISRPYQIDRGDPASFGWRCSFSNTGGDNSIAASMAPMLAVAMCQ